MCHARSMSRVGTKNEAGEEAIRSRKLLGVGIRFGWDGGEGEGTDA